MAGGHRRRRRPGLGAPAQRADHRRVSRRSLRAAAGRGPRGARHRYPHPLRAAARRVPVQLLARCRQPTRPVAADHAGALPIRGTGVGRPDRRRRARPHRRRQLGVGRRRRDRARPHPRADQPVARRLGCRDRARIRHGDKDIRRRRLRTSGGQVPDRVGGPRHPAGGNRFRPRLDDRVRLPAGGQALATRPAVVRGDNGVLRTGHRRDRVGIGGPHPRIRAHAGASGGRLLQRSGLRVTRRRTGADRRTHRRCRCTGSGC